MSDSKSNVSKFELPDNIKNLLGTKIPEDIKASLKNIKLNIPKVEFDYEAFYKASENIGKWGWTVPFSFTLYQIRFFENDNLTKEDIDTFFEIYYSEDDNFDRMINAILNINDIHQWHEAIKQSVYAHKNMMFILSVSTLIPVLEGILSTFESDKTNIRMMKVCKEMLDTTNDNSMIDKIMWTSCFNFISALYQKSDFSGKEPELVNRHWILHGRTAFNNSEIDSLRIFNAIETVSNIVKYHNKKQNKN
ncbi:hypothetical protein EDM59_21100 [Brevibacillus nitrificans]|uniref:Uncharacterized protein n=1 Tax=Brevibacillus nitrificans TaxID=651560 RepID=A0A3M8D333_9BACL|nr:hypothetical protein [Brevibacillus nitrificans]RNB82109.1 hypothetical protein EDM59_21100 [Brevibacillus nitrificans]